MRSPGPNHRNSSLWAITNTGLLLIHLQNSFMSHVSHLFHTLVELYTEVLASRWESVKITDCLYAHTYWHLDSFGGSMNTGNLYWHVWQGRLGIGHLPAFVAFRKPQMPGLLWCHRLSCCYNRSPLGWSWSRGVWGPLDLSCVPCMCHQSWLRLSTSLGLGAVRRR